MVEMPSCDNSINVQTPELAANKSLLIQAPKLGQLSTHTALPVNRILLSQNIQKIVFSVFEFGSPPKDALTAGTHLERWYLRENPSRNAKELRLLVGNTSQYCHVHAAMSVCSLCCFRRKLLESLRIAKDAPYKET